MSAFEITLLVSLYAFTVFIELNFLASDYEGRQMRRIDSIVCLICIILSPIILALQIGEIIYHKLRD